MKNKTLMKTLSTILAVLMLLCSAPLSGFVGIELPDWFSLKTEAYYTEGNFTYSVYSGKATLTGCVDATGDIVIPETLGGYPVTSIDYEAFYGCTNLASVTIGNSVTSIGHHAFSNCTSLTSITIPDSVTSIGIEAFEDCTSLTSVTLGSGVTSIDYNVFYNCTSLENVYYTGDIESWCGIEFGDYFANPMYYAKNFYINNTLVKEIVIPDTVTEIKYSAFYGFEGITSVTIGDSVTSIGDYAFYGCTSLARVYYTGDIESWCGIEFGDYFANPMYYAKNFYINNTLVKEIVIPDTVTEIKDYAFYSFEGITSITIPDSVTSIGGYAFSGCTSLASVTIPDSVESIGKGAFFDCTSLASVTIGNSVTSIGDWAFSGCTSLASVTIPGSVTSIGEGAFGNVYKLEDVYYTGDIESWCNISFDTSDANPTCYAGDIYINGEIVEHVTISEATTAIKAYVFYNCNSIKNVTIPESVITIHENAFYNCYKVENVYYSGTDAQWDEIAIYNGNDCLKNANKTFLNGGHAHVYNSTVTTKPTCTESGLKALKCYCGDSYTEVIPATGHIWGKWVVTLEPTATKDGRKVRACTVCVEAIQEEVIPKGTNPDIPDEPDEPETESEVKVSDFTLNYKGTGKINPEINVSGKYTVDYVSSDETIVTVDKDGNVTATGEGTAEITVIVTDVKGNLFADTCKVTVTKAWWQWLIIIFLFGWIWYI